MTLKEYIVAHIDKVVHFFAGMSLGLMLGKWPFWSFLAVCFCAIGKEISDYVLKNGTPEVLDAFFTILGGAIGIGWFALVLR